MRSRAHGELVRTRVHAYQFTHAKVGHLCSAAFTNQQDVVAGEISVDDVVGVKVGQGKCHIMTDVKLGVVRDRWDQWIVPEIWSDSHPSAPSRKPSFVIVGLSQCPETGQCLDA